MVAGGWAVVVRGASCLVPVRTSTAAIECWVRGRPRVAGRRQTSHAAPVFGWVGRLLPGGRKRPSRLQGPLGWDVCVRLRAWVLRDGHTTNAGDHTSRTDATCGLGGSPATPAPHAPIDRPPFFERPPPPARPQTRRALPATRATAGAAAHPRRTAPATFLVSRACCGAGGHCNAPAGSTKRSGFRAGVASPSLTREPWSP